MTTPSDQTIARPASTPAEALRAAADFIEFSGVRDGVAVTCSAGRVQIRVTAPYGDVAARQAVVTRLAGLIGGTVRQEHEREFPAAELRAAGAIGRLRALVSTSLAVRRAGPSTQPGRPFAQAPGGGVETVPGRLPSGWRWVTALDPDPRHAARQDQRGAAPAPAADEAPVLAARACPPLTSAALRAAARHEQGTAVQHARPGGTARRALAQPPW